MKRPNIEVLFGAVPMAPPALVEVWLRHVLGDLGGTLGRYYALAPANPESGEHEHVREELNLRDPDDLLRRASRDGEVAWSVRLPFGFANADVIVTVFLDHATGESCTHLVIEPNITQFIETEPSTRLAFIATLMNSAVKIHSSRFLAGLDLPWVPLSAELLATGGHPEATPYVAGWQTLDPLPSFAAVRSWPLPPPQIVVSVRGYAIATRWPD
jgi:hypothetical protein